MKNIFSLIILVLLVVGCCQDQIVSTYQIPENAKRRIPFDQDLKLSYVSEQNIFYTASTTGKELVLNTERLGPESCDVLVNEILKSSVFIHVFDFGFEFILEKTYNDELLFYVKRYWEDGGYQLYSTHCDNYSYEDSLTDIEINGNSFSNVLVFQTCMANSGINRIIFSPENGIEYIDFESGRFLRLIKN